MCSKEYSVFSRDYVLRGAAGCREYNVFYSSTEPIHVLYADKFFFIHSEIVRRCVLTTEGVFSRLMRFLIPLIVGREFTGRSNGYEPSSSFFGRGYSSESRPAKKLKTLYHHMNAFTSGGICTNPLCAASSTTIQ